MRKKVWPCANARPAQPAASVRAPARAIRLVIVVMDVPLLLERPHHRRDAASCRVSGYGETQDQGRPGRAKRRPGTHAPLGVVDPGSPLRSGRDDLDLKDD